MEYMDLALVDTAVAVVVAVVAVDTAVAEN